MPPRIVRLPGIDRVDVPTARQSVPPLHAYLRARILDGTLAPGTKLSQAALANQLGVSRTPLREVLRMLQEEGLISAQPNQRMLVTELDPAELDSDYAQRILVGSLAMTMTIGRFRAADRRTAQRLLTRMRRAARNRDIDGWLISHNAYHEIFDTGAPEPLRRHLVMLADRSVRFVRLRQHDEQHHWADVGNAEHPAILEAVVAGDCAAAVAALAHHLAGTALRVLAAHAPDYVPAAVPRAVSVVTQTGQQGTATAS